MRWWRWYLLMVLAGAPVAILCIMGFYYLWQSGYGLWTGWLVTLSLGLAYFLAWRWQKQQKLLRNPSVVPLAWTERDKHAWKLVEARANEMSNKKMDELVSLNVYVDTAQALAFELARFYHPKAADPVSSLTIPELLAVVELAAHDLAQMVDQYLPGGHLLTLRDFQRIKSLADWYPAMRNIGWVMSTLFSPFNTAARYLTTQAGLARPWQALQENAVVWFFTAYVHRMGAYLIDLNSGRLRIGASRYLELKKQLLETPSEMSADQEPQLIKIVLMGQTNAGKSSLINALLGEQKAATDLLPSTDEIARYSLRHTAIATALEIVDTVGYGASGASQKQQQATAQACQQADVILLVLHARNPARQVDLEQVKLLKEHFEKNPSLQCPPILVVMTHIDLLSPAMEWSPPYDWQKPVRSKEKSIAEAVEEVQTQFGTLITGVIPVCASATRVYGVAEWLMPALATVMSQAQAVAFLRCVQNEADRDKTLRIFHQLLAAGKGLLDILAQSRRKK